MGRGNSLDCSQDQTYSPDCLRRAGGKQRLSGAGTHTLSHLLGTAGMNGTHNLRTRPVPVISKGGRCREPRYQQEQRGEDRDYLFHSLQFGPTTRFLTEPWVCLTLPSTLREQESRDRLMIVITEERGPLPNHLAHGCPKHIVIRGNPGPQCVGQFLHVPAALLQRIGVDRRGTTPPGNPSVPANGSSSSSAPNRLRKVWQAAQCPAASTRDLPRLCCSPPQSLAGICRFQNTAFARREAQSGC